VASDVVLNVHVLPEEPDDFACPIHWSTIALPRQLSQLSQKVSNDHHHHPSIEGKPIRDYLGIVTGEVIVGANIFKDLFAGIRDIVGGRAGAYEQTLRDARYEAFRELESEAKRLGADAVIGVDIDYEVVGSGGSMLMVSVSGTAVTF
jgi:uncharacterized protein YbjQ (UPF0145 family)